MEQHLLPATPRSRQVLLGSSSIDVPTPPVTPKGRQLTVNNLTRTVALLIATAIIVLAIPLARVAWNRANYARTQDVSYTFTEAPAALGPTAVEFPLDGGLPDPEVSSLTEVQETDPKKNGNMGESVALQSGVSGDVSAEKVKPDEQAGDEGKEGDVPAESKQTDDAETSEKASMEESNVEAEGSAASKADEDSVAESKERDEGSEDAQTNGDNTEATANEGEEKAAESGEKKTENQESEDSTEDEASASDAKVDGESAPGETNVEKESSEEDSASSDESSNEDSSAADNKSASGQSQDVQSLMDEAAAAGLPLPSNPLLCSSRPDDIDAYTHPKLVGDHGGWLSYRGSTLDFSDCRLFLTAATTPSPFNTTFRLPLPASPNALPPLSSPPVPKIAFLFLSRSAIPFHELWARFFHGHEGYYSIYIHSMPGYVQAPEVWSGMQGRQVASKPVFWGSLSIVEAMKRLISNALLDPLNARFIILSEADIPMRPFPHVYRYILSSNRSFAGGYRKFFRDRRTAMGIFPPRLVKEGWVFGDAWMEMARPHARAVVWEWEMHEMTLQYCRTQHSPACCVDENLIQTVLTERFPQQIHNRSLMYTYWQKPTDAHPSRFWRYDVTPEVLASMREDRQMMRKDGFDAKYVTEETAEELRVRANRTCTTDEGEPTHCALFARKFDRSASFRLVTFAKTVLGF